MATGQQDEIMFIDPSSFRTSIAQWFDLPTDMIALDPVENKMVSPWNSPNVKPYFEYLNSLVQEGILDPSVAGNWELMAQKRAETSWDACGTTPMPCGTSPPWRRLPPMRCMRR